MIQPTLSIALCTYNGARYLSEELDSIAAQTQLPDELVVCDDGSTDGTVEVIRSFAKCAPFPVRLHVNDRNLGSTKNFEGAIGLCCGDIIALADQDDLWRPEKLERIMAAFADNPRAGAVFSDAEVVDEDLKPLGYRMWNPGRFTHAEQKAVREGRALEVLIRRNVIGGATMAFRAAHRDAVLPIPNTWLHDAWIAFIISAVSELAMLTAPLILYRQHPNNQTGAGEIRRGLFGSRVRKRKRRVAVAPIDKCAALVEQFERARERLLSLDGVRPDAIAQVEAKIRHLKARTAMARCRSRWQRLPLGFGELSTLRYYRYSNRGFWKFAKDLLRKPAGQV